MTNTYASGLDDLINAPIKDKKYTGATGGARRQIIFGIEGSGQKRKKVGDVGSDRKSKETQGTAVEVGAIRNFT